MIPDRRYMSRSRCIRLKAVVLAGVVAGSGLFAGVSTANVAPHVRALPGGATTGAAIPQLMKYAGGAQELYSEHHITDGMFIQRNGGFYDTMQRSVATGAWPQNVTFAQVGWSQDYRQQVILFEAYGEMGNTKTAKGACIYAMYVGAGISKVMPSWFAASGLPKRAGMHWSWSHNPCGAAHTPATAPTPYNVRQIATSSGVSWVSKPPTLEQIGLFIDRG